MRLSSSSSPPPPASSAGLLGPPGDVPGEATLLARMHGLVAGPGPAAEAGALVTGEGLADLRLGVHDEGTVLRDRLADGPALQQQHLALVGARLQRDLGVAPQLEAVR